MSQAPDAPSAPPAAYIADRRLSTVTQRSGARSAVWAMTVHIFRRMVGLRRPGRYKLFPLMFLLGPFLPAIGFLGFAAIVPSELSELTDQVLPSGALFYPVISVSLFLFTTLVAPHALTPDRRHGTLGLLLASQLNRATYLASGALAIVGALLLVTVGPPLLLSLGLALIGVEGPAVVLVILRALGGGLVLAVLYGAVGMAASAVTDRWGFAAAGTFATFFGLPLITGVLSTQLDVPDWVQLLAVNVVATEAAFRIHGEVSVLPDLSNLMLTAGVVGWLVALGALVWWRYGSVRTGR